MPHGKTDAVNEAVMVFAKLEQKVEWESLDNNPVDLVFLLGVPEKMLMTYTYKSYLEFLENLWMKTLLISLENRNLEMKLQTF
ncbi:PTS sugar transporter subunit IIA [Caloramator sp. mosi_1]|nr:PTS sugar transporter subunit IIA [Caloramator sp. mosi_1]WDC85587.1 PTS sugar transporter subunit IIA [Caloramator sp. mosi_1]